MHSLAERVLADIRNGELLRPGDRLGVAVSGGIDSLALLRLLIELRQELGVVLSVVHFNHKLRGAEADSDQQFVAELAREHGLDFHSAGGDAGERAAHDRAGVEAAARELRYEFFGRLLGSSDSRAEAEDAKFAGRSAGSGGLPESALQGLKPESVDEPDGTAQAAPFHGHVPQNVLNKIATGHTLDDQAETVLMRMIRGTGPRGLGGIYPRLVVEGDDGQSHGEIIRPLLRIRRRDLERYLVEINQPWREDATNTEDRFTRNRVRKLVLPLLEREFNPGVAEGLSELAEMARDEEDYWDNEVSGWLGTVVQWSEPEWARAQETSLVQIQFARAGSRNASADSDLQSRISNVPWLVMNASLSRPWLLTETKAVQRRVMKAIGEEAGIPLEFKHVEEILRFAAEDGPAGKELSLPLGWRIIREPEAILFVTPDLRRKPDAEGYEYALPLPGRVFVGEAGLEIEAVEAGPADWAEYNPQQLLRADLLNGLLTVRNWRPGDRFWPAHTKSPKKVKELLQERHVSGIQRRLWPVIAMGDEIVWMRGFPVPAKLSATPGNRAVLIRDRAWGE